jgi:hypothetical protein
LINIEISCRCLLAIVFACSSFAKLRNGASFRRFRAWLGDLPVPVAARHVSASAAAVACAEVLIVVPVVLPWTVLAGFVLAAATLAVFLAGACLAIARERKPLVTASAHAVRNWGRAMSRGTPSCSPRRLSAPSRRTQMAPAPPAWP